MSEKFKTLKRKRRTCWDRLRARWLENRRRRRRDPAASTASQLLAMFTIIVGSAPRLVPVVAPYVAPPLSPGQVRRNDMARRLGIPARYVDTALSLGTVPYSILFEHVRRGGRSREDAMTVLRQKSPDACRDWLDHVEQWGTWSDLLLCQVREGVDEDTDIKLLRATLAWLKAKSPEATAPLPTGDGSSVVAGAAMTPEGNSVKDDDSDDPDRPKP